MLFIFIFLVHHFLFFIELHRLNKVLNLVLQLRYFLCKFIFVIILDTLTQKLESRSLASSSRDHLRSTMAGALTMGIILRMGGGYSRNFCLGMCPWDP